MQRRFYFYAIFILVIGILLLIHILMNEQGLPIIQQRVDQQLSNLISESPDLKGLVVGTENSVHMEWNTHSLKGRFQYYAEFNGSNVDLFVYWAGKATNCQITKIESATTYTEPKVLWSDNQN